jgi:trehalose 6-phosphate synthase
LLERYPEQKGRFVLVQIAEPSRTKLPAYSDVRANVRSTAQRINGRFGNADYCPIILLEAQFTGDDVARLMRAADLCIVSSLHEGMNLVSKEFVRSRDDERGVLLLSMFAGASRELDMAVPINPHDPHGLADALALALAMPAQEQRIRMRCLRKVVAQADAHGWAARIIADATGAPSPQTMMPLRTAYSTTSAVL